MKTSSTWREAIPQGGPLFRGQAILVGPGASLLAILMAGAAGSHLHAEDPVLMAVPAFVLLALLSALAYARRTELLALVPGANAARA